MSRFRHIGRHASSTSSVNAPQSAKQSLPPAAAASPGATATFDAQELPPTEHIEKRCKTLNEILNENPEHLLPPLALVDELISV